MSEPKQCVHCGKMHRKDDVDRCLADKRAKDDPDDPPTFIDGDTLESTGEPGWYGRNEQAEDRKKVREHIEAFTEKRRKK